MKTIPESFTTRGFNHRLVERTQTAAIYSQEHRATGRIMAFEVLVIAVARKQGVNPRSGVITLPGDETLPGESRWGQKAWTVGTIGAARARMARLDHRREA